MNGLLIDIYISKDGVGDKFKECILKENGKLEIYELAQEEIGKLFKKYIND